MNRSVSPRDPCVGFTAEEIRKAARLLAEASLCGAHAITPDGHTFRCDGRPKHKGEHVWTLLTN